MVFRYLILSSVINFLFADIVQFGGELYMDGQNARNIGMGGYSASFSTGANPAQLMHIQESSMHFSHKDKFAGLSSVSTFSYLYPKLIHGIQYPIFISLVNRSVNDIPDTRSAKDSDGSIDYSRIEDISMQELGFTFATIYNMNHYTIGFSIKPFYTGLAEYKAWGISGDFGVMAPFLENRMKLGCKIENIFSLNRWDTGTIESYAPLFIGGGQIQLKSLLLGIEVGSRLTDDPPLNYHAGFEFHKQNEIVIIRGGVSHNNLFSAGIGFALKRLQVDYAYIHPLKTLPFEPSHIMSLVIFLDKLSDLKGKITP